MAIAYDVNLDLLRILEIACVNGTHQISVRGVSADFRVVKYANTTLIWGSGGTALEKSYEAIQKHICDISRLIVNLPIFLSLCP